MTELFFWNGNIVGDCDDDDIYDDILSKARQWRRKEEEASVADSLELT